MTTTNDRTLRQLLDQIGSKRDELRVQLHLAGMDFKKEWGRIETKLRDLAEVETLADEARLQLHLARLNASDELKAVGESLTLIGDAIDREGAELSKEMKEAFGTLAEKVEAFRKRTKKAS